MSSIVYLKNKNNGRTYAYLNESVWDSESKKCKCKRKCLGHLDPVTGEIVPNKRNDMGESATVKSMGATFFLREISDRIGLTEAIKESIPDQWELFLSCVFYILVERRPLSDITYWTEDTDLPFKGEVTIDTVKHMLSEIDENEMFLFFRSWRDRFDKNDFFNIYVSPTVSYDRKVETIRFNDLPLLVIDQKTDISVTVDVSTMMPVSYVPIDYVPRTYTDIRRVANKELWLDYQRNLRVLDESFYSENNLSDLLKQNERFVMKLPIESKLATDNIERVRDRVMDMQYLKTIMGESFFVMSFLNYFDGRKCYVHIVYSTADAEKEFSSFLELIQDCKHELQNKIYIPEHKDFYNKYFMIRDRSWGVEVEENGEAVMTYNTVAGFAVFLSNTAKNPEDALEMFMRRNYIKTNFENLKNERDRVHLDLNNDVNYNGRVFLQFSAQILSSEINRIMSKHSILKGMSFTDVVREMGKYKKMTIPGFDTPFFTNINNSQSKIMKAFDIDIKDMR